jgi:hypothetical protein
LPGIREPPPSGSAIPQIRARKTRRRRPATNENARDRGVSGASFLRIPQFLIGVAPSGYRPANPRFAPGIHFSASPSDLPATRAACRSPALPSNPTSDSHRLSDSPVGSPACLQLAPSTCLAAQPSGRSVDLRLRLRPPDRLSVQPATCAACRSSSPPYDLPQARALWLIVRLRFPANLQLAPSTGPPALPSNLTSDSHRLLHPSASPSCQPCGLRLQSTFRPCLPASFQLAPSANLPALPSNLPATCAACCSGLRLHVNFRLAPSIDLSAHRHVDLQLAPSIPFSGSAFRFASSLRRLPTFQPCLQTQPPTLIECLILRLACSRSPACAFNQHYLLNLLA